MNRYVMSHDLFAQIRKDFGLPENCARVRINIEPGNVVTVDAEIQAPVTAASWLATMTKRYLLAEKLA